MNVLIVQPWIRLGGAEVVSTYLAAGLVRKGHRVRIACSFLSLNGMPPHSGDLEYLLPPRRLAQALENSRLLFLLLGPWVLLWIVWKHSGEVDVLNPHEFPASWVAVIVGTLRRIPTVWSSYGPTRRFSLKEIFKIGFIDWLGWRFASSWIDRSLVRSLTSIQVPSELSQNLILRRYDRPTDVNPLGVDSTFYGAGTEAGFMKNYELHGKFLLACVGKLHPQENQIVCLEALRKILPSIPNAYLIFAGDGPMRGRLSKMAMRWNLDKHVRFIGHISSWAVRDLYASCALHLYPPVEESWGLAPFEALCAGRLSIVSQECGAAEVIGYERIGIVCEPSGQEYAQRIEEFHAEPFRFEKMANRGKRYVTTGLSWQKHSDNAIELMRRSINSHGAATKSVILREEAGR